MVEISPNVFVGGDDDYEKVKVKSGWSCLRCAKFGSGGHKDILGYETQAAPEGKNQYWVKKGNLMALNLLDLHDPNFIDTEMIQKGLNFIKDHVDNFKVLIACNHGYSRGPTIGLMWLRTIGRMPYGFMQAEKHYRNIYPKYDPTLGIEQFARMHWPQLLNGVV